MSEFKLFLENQDLKTTVNKLPNKFKKLIKNYKINFENGNTLKGDSEHVGVITNHPTKKITVAAPWRYSREFTTLHEIGHLVWAELNDSKKKQWRKIVKNTKEKQNQNSEELFCMAFANYYAKHQIVIHHHDDWNRFISSL